MGRNDCTVGEYLLARLKGIGVDHLFGVPGDFVLAFLNFDDVTVPEWVQFPGAPTARQGVRQARHAHALLERGRGVMERLLPA